MRLMCPSAQPQMADAVILGVRSGVPDAPYVSYLERPLCVSDELLTLAEPVKPTEVFRFAARCEEQACRHFDGSDCKLATRIVQILPVAVESLPRCNIRVECRWFRQQGRAACLRCPQVITEVREPSEEFRRAAMPD
jgi:hypothetical protein